MLVGRWPSMLVGRWPMSTLLYNQLMIVHMRLWNFTCSFHIFPIIQLDPYWSCHWMCYNMVIIVRIDLWSSIKTPIIIVSPLVTHVDDYSYHPSDDSLQLFSPLLSLLPTIMIVVYLHILLPYTYILSQESILERLTALQSWNCAHCQLSIII